MAPSQCAKSPMLYSDLLFCIFLYTTPDNFLEMGKVCKLWRGQLNSSLFAQSYVSSFFKLDLNRKGYLEYLFSNPAFTTKQWYDYDRLMKRIFKVQKYSQVLEVLSLVYADCRSGLDQFENIVNSLDRKRFCNEQYVKSILKEMSLVSNNFELIPEMSVSFIDLDDILFRVYNCSGVVYTKDISFSTKRWDFVLFSSCGFPVLVSFEGSSNQFSIGNTIQINGIDLFRFEEGYDLVSDYENLKIAQKIFNIQYEPVGYCGIDESFSHESILSCIFVTWFHKILTYSPIQLGMDDMEQDVIDGYSVMEVPIWDDLISDIKLTYGKNAFTIIETPKKKRNETKRKINSSIQSFTEDDYTNTATNNKKFMKIQNNRKKIRTSISIHEILN